MSDQILSRDELKRQIERLRTRVAELEAGSHEGTGSLHGAPGDVLFDTLADVVPAGIFIYQDDEVVYANRAGFELTGLEPGDPAGIDWRTHIHPDYRDLVRERAVARQEGVEVPRAYEIKIVKKTGESAWVLLDTKLVEFRGEPATLAIAVDISERKKAEEEMLASWARLDAIFESTGDYILLSDQRGNPVYFNRAYAAIMKEMLGIEMRPGFKPHTLLPDPAEREKWEGFHRRALGGESFVEEYSMPDPSGRMRYLEVSYYPVRQEERIVGFCEFTHEVTERREQADRLARMQEEQAAQLRRIAGGLSHEIHNALYPANTSLYSLKERLETRGGVEGERDLRLLGLALRGFQRALDLTESVRLFSKLERITTKESIKLKPAVKEVFGQHEGRFRELGVSTEVAVDEKLRVHCPRGYLYSVLDNLVVNGLDAMQEAEERRFSVVADLADGLVRIRASDTGSGIGAEEQEQIFEPFFTTKLTMGTGLGLAIVKRIVDLCGGEISVESEQGKGTTFILSLPGDDRGR